MVFMFVVVHLNNIYVLIFISSMFIKFIWIANLIKYCFISKKLTNLKINICFSVLCLFEI